MRLKQIRLSGFKSFARPVEINLTKGINAVVGPNGSGKSNIVDAILWVFGENSMKNIRANDKTDVIFAGSDGMAPSASANVVLVFEKEEGKTFEVSRLLSRNGKNEYFLNGEKARRKDIKSIFEGTGAGKELYSIVSQGRVDKILNSSPEEIRLLIEEAAGISSYKKKKKETITKIDVTNDNLARVEDILAELDKQRKGLYLKAKRAEKYQEYTKDLSEIQIQYFSHLNKKWMDKKNSLSERTEKNREELKEIQRELIKVEGRYHELRNEFSSSDKEMEGFTSILEEYKERQNNLTDLRNMYAQQLSTKEIAYVENTTKLDAAEGESQKLRNRKSEINMIYKTIAKDIEENSGKLSELEAEKKSIIGEYSDEENEIMELQQTVNDKERETGKLENELMRLGDSIEDHGKRVKVITSQLESKSERLEGFEYELDELRESGTESSQKESELIDSLNQVKGRMNENILMIKEIEERKYQYIQQSKHLEAEKAVLERQMRDFAGYARPVKELFHRKENDTMLRNMIDVVANLMEFDTEFGKAFEVILGGRTQNIVTKDTETAKYAVDVLKRENFGRCTFLPLDNLKIRPIVQNPQLNSHKGFVGYAAELVQMNEEFSKLPLYLFGDTIIVKTLEDGLEIRRNYRVSNQIVSLDGDLIASRGAITGGSMRVDTKGSLLARKGRLTEVEEELTALDKVLRKIQKQEKKLLTEKQEIAGLKINLETELNDIMLKNASIRRTLQELTTSIKEITQEVDELEKLKIDYNAKIAGAEARQERVTEEIATLKTEIEMMKGELSNVSTTLQTKKLTIQNLQDTINNLKLELNTSKERKRQYDDEIKDIISTIESNIEKINDYKHNMKELDREIEENKTKVSELEIELTSLKKETETLYDSIKDQQEGRQQVTKQIEELEKKLENLKDERENKREKSHKLEIEEHDIEFQVQSLYEKMAYAGVHEEDLQDVVLSEEEETKVGQDVATLEKKIKYLGNVDLNAIDEYEQVNERYTEIDEQKTDLENARKSLEELLEKTDKEAKEIFIKTFNEINTNFNEMTTTLFGGGNGNLRLIPGQDILETGIEISVKRPGKKNQKMYLLSGGEKSLVGIALVFSMLTINPSPFYILDEVDAALDDYNAERLKLLVERFKGMAQFIVITHNKLVMEGADVLYGITQTSGVSMVMAVELEKYAV